MSKVIQDLKAGVVLAELGGHGNGPYCGRNAAHAGHAYNDPVGLEGVHKEVAAAK